MLRKTLLPTTFFCAIGCCIMALAWSCSPNANLQGTGVNYLQGQWQQQPNALNQQLVSYTLYNFKFTCDSFYVTMQSHSKVNYGADTCMNKGQWTEYAKGFYNLRNDTLHLKGFFCNANYSLKNLGGCFRAGVYEEYFKTVQKSDSLVQFTNTSGVLPLSLRLVKRANCIPKPL